MVGVASGLEVESWAEASPDRITSGSKNFPGLYRRANTKNNWIPFWRGVEDWVLHRSSQLMLTAYQIPKNLPGTKCTPVSLHSILSCVGYRQEFHFLKTRLFSALWFPVRVLLYFFLPQE